MWFKCLFITLMVLELMGQVLQIGKPRDPRTVGEVAFSVGFNTLLILGLLHYWGR
jgi:hypothetical protein